METQTSQSAKSEPLVIEQAGMRMTIGHRKGLGGNDEGLTFDITTADSAEEKRILRYDCFYNNPHYHIGVSDDLRGFYAFHECLTEAWDGPAAISFTDVLTWIPDCCT